jgi:hypothetical protein
MATPPSHCGESPIARILLRAFLPDWRIMKRRGLCFPPVVYSIVCLCFTFEQEIILTRVKFCRRTFRHSWLRVDWHGEGVEASAKLAQRRINHACCSVQNFWHGCYSLDTAPSSSRNYGSARHQDRPDWSSSVGVVVDRTVG